ncbi:hypothetical protein MMSR116_30850 [Methylobacterium mesophilicum SR1.6/6]|uniref:Transketolase signature 1 domain-containing protein n=1 Tax=Methylobacterium mesophilicum SR1.6/6 TaxID=908290 RepID=A0A6B9FUZ9_9HYPH|nr:hypothetical protein MMSR116_30850 [Methylobacterium mesophilicum SR1.6/6]
MRSLALSPEQSALLDRIPNPAALRGLPESELQAVADAVRAEMIDAVSITGGHLGSGLAARQSRRPARPLVRRWLSARSTSAAGADEPGYTDTQMARQQGCCGAKHFFCRRVATGV